MDINGYRLISELKSDNSGFSKWGFAEKNGRVLFIKQFLSPVYPINTGVLSAEQVRKKADICRQFESRKRAFYNRLDRCATGNIITVLDFFRFESKYYIVTEKVETKSLTPEEIAVLPSDKKLLILKTILHSISSLHGNGIVHADIKPNNILIKGTVKGFYTAKIIDFDSGFIERDTSAEMNTEGDLVYLAPETFAAIAEDEKNAGKLTHKVDIFALGILFHQYLTGRLPGFDKEYDYVFEAVLDGGKISIDSRLEPKLQEIIRKMLSKDPNARPEASSIFDMLTEGQPKSAKKPETEHFKSALKSTMRSSAKNAAKSSGGFAGKTGSSFLKPAGDV